MEEIRHADYLVEADLRLVRDLVVFRKQRNITQATVVERMGIDPSGVSKIEAGHRDLLQSTIRRYALAIGVVIDHKIRAFEVVDAGSPQPGHGN